MDLPQGPSWPSGLLSPDPAEVMAAAELALSLPVDPTLLPDVLAALAALPIPYPRHDPPPPVALRLLDLVAHTLQAVPPSPARESLLHTSRAAQADQRRHDVFSAHLDLLSAFSACGAVPPEAFAAAWSAFPSLRTRGALTEYLLRLGMPLPIHLLLEREGRRHELHQPYARHFLSSNPSQDALALYRHGDLLDLSGTGLMEWPEAASALQGIQRLDLRGTRIRRVPAAIRANLLAVEARWSTLIALRMQVVAEGACEGPFEQEMQVRHGLALFRRGLRAEALPHFRKGISKAIDIDVKVVGKANANALEALLACAAEAGDWALCLRVIQTGRPTPNPHNPYRKPAQRRDGSVAAYWPSFHASSFHAVMAGRIHEWGDAVKAYLKEDDPFSLQNWWSWHRHFRRLLEHGQEAQMEVLLRLAKKNCRRLELTQWDLLWTLRLMEERGNPEAALRIFHLMDPFPAKPDENLHWQRLLRVMRAYLREFHAQGDDASVRMLASRLPAYARKAGSEKVQPWVSAYMKQLAQELNALAEQYLSQ